MSTMTREISNNDDVIDSRDVIARLEELDSDNIDRLTELLQVGPFEVQRRYLFENTDGTRDLNEDDRDELRELQAWLREMDDEDLAELKALRDLAEQGESLEDWIYGAQLIRHSYFVEYAQELAEDIGAIDREAAWPAQHIDWEAAADELQTDYTDIDYNGVTYWAR